MHLLFGVLLFVLMHITVWWSTNAQFISSWTREEALTLAIVLSVPITLFAFFAAKYTYSALNEEVWAVRFVGFGVSYLVFPLLTWFFLDESMFTWKTLSCIALSCVIICIQVWG